MPRHEERGNKEKTQIQEIRNAEDKCNELLRRRNELSDQASAVRAERDAINEERKKKYEEMNQFKAKRDELNSQMRLHKEKRNELQNAAKDLIESFKGKKKGVFKSLPLHAEELKAEIQMMEYKQETVPMPVQEENALISHIRAKWKEYQEIGKKISVQEKIQVDLSDTEKAIHDLFNKADAEHAQVQEFYKEAQDSHKKFMDIVQEISYLIAESNKKHEDYIKLREQANSFHEKAMEMRINILEMRKESRKKIDELKASIRQQNEEARKALHDETRIAQKQESSIEELKQGKKIVLGGGF